MKILVFLILVFNVGILNAQKKSTLTIENPDIEGAMVGTISVEDRRIIVSSYDFYYGNDSTIKEVKEKEKGFFWSKYPGKIKTNNRIRVYNSGPHFKEGKKWYFIFSIVKEAGIYNFYELGIYTNTGTAESTLKIPLDIPFEIEKGKTKYIGEINLNVKKGEILFLNNLERDRAYFKEKYPDITF